MPLPERWLTSLYLRYNGSGLLIDCGEGTQIALKQNGWSFKSIDTICFTHYHADHISGLVGILLAMANADRTEKVTLFGPKGLERTVNGLRVIAPELPFPVECREFDTFPFMIEHCGYEITSFRLRHSMLCCGYQIRCRRGGKFDPERAKAAGIPLRFWNPLQKGQTIEENGRIYQPEMVLGPERKGIKIVYATDTRPVPEIAKYAEKADLLITEGMYGDPEKDQKAVEHKHMTMREAAEIAAGCQPDRLWLTHYSPSMMHPEWYLKDVRKVFPATELGEDGKTIELNFSEDK